MIRAAAAVCGADLLEYPVARRDQGQHHRDGPDRILISCPRGGARREVEGKRSQVAEALTKEHGSGGGDKEFQQRRCVEKDEYSDWSSYCRSQGGTRRKGESRESMWWL